VNSLWLVLTALAAFLVAYRFYGAFLATRVAMLNDRRITPAHRLRDDVDYHPTRRLVLFGVHFAAIAGSGPLVGPVLASQWGYFPGFCWIVIGSCLAGGVHDFVVLLASVRKDGKSLPQIARELLGPVVGTATTVAVLFIVVATLAATAKVVVNALNESAWGMFTIIVTIPAALLTGFWMNKIRPGRIGEASAIGVTLVMLGVVIGQPFDDSAYRGYLVFSPNTLAIMLPIYAAVVSILPVWVLLCPRDYLSSYMKVGVIAMLGLGILIVQPPLKMPAMTPFIHGGGPISGTLWPFVFIVIACGALSGFHALISSGTTPKMINRETDIRPVGYGAMLMEGFVSLTALVAACALEPGDYFKINTEKSQYAQLMLEARERHQWDLHDVELARLQAAAGVKEDTAGRSGGAVTLALGMAKVLAKLPGMNRLTAYLYHFVIMFEALFILTLLETGTRVARFIFQETLVQLRGKPRADHETSWTLNVVASVVVCALWGYLLYHFEIGRLWLMMGIANQLLAVIGLAIGTTYILQYSPKRIYALCTGIPFVLVAVTVFTAGIESIWLWWQRQAAAGLSPADVFSYRLMCGLVSAILLLGALIVAETVRRWIVIVSTPAQPQPEPELAAVGATE
jgi:carbon starvation protein